MSLSKIISVCHSYLWYPFFHLGPRTSEVPLCSARTLNLLWQSLLNLTKQNKILSWCAICAFFDPNQSLDSIFVDRNVSQELEEAGFILIRAPYFASRNYGLICTYCLRVTCFSRNLLFNYVMILFRMCGGFIITVLFVQIVVLPSLEK